MFATFDIATSQLTRLPQMQTPSAANDNCYLHLVSDKITSLKPNPLTPLRPLLNGIQLDDDSQTPRSVDTAINRLAPAPPGFDSPDQIRRSVYNAAGQLVAIDNVTTGEKTDYIRAGGKTIARLVNSVPTYLHNDHLGSASTGTTSSGNIAWRELYSPYGETLNNISANQDRDGFTGHIKDSATGLNYMQARYYDPLIGRFLSIDPVGFSPDRPGMFNRYAYSLNDPVNMIDPDGRNPAAVCLIPPVGAGVCAPAAAAVGNAVVAGVAIVGGIIIANEISENSGQDDDTSGNDTTPEGKEIRDHGKKGSGQEYIEGQGHTGESVDEIFGEESETFDDGSHDNASGQEKTPTEVTVGPNGDWARTNTKTGEIIQVNDKNNPRQPIPEPKQ